MVATLHTSLGDVKVEADCGCCPQESGRFLVLCAGGFLDGAVFQEIVCGRLVQCRQLRGPSAGESAGEHLGFGEAGRVGFAPDGSLFITTAPAPELEGTHRAFGRVIHGLFNCEAAARSPVLPGGRPLRPLQIRGATVHANPLADRDNT